MKRFRLLQKCNSHRISVANMQAEICHVFSVFCSLRCGSGISCGNGFWNRYCHHAALTNFVREISGAPCQGDSSLRRRNSMPEIARVSHHTPIQHATAMDGIHKHNFFNLALSIMQSSATVPGCCLLETCKISAQTLTLRLEQGSWV